MSIEENNINQSGPGSNQKQGAPGSSFIQSSEASPNIVAGALAGAGAAVVSAGIWAAITYFTNFQLGLMAIALGCVVGLSVKKFGHGNSKTFGIIAAVEALFGCLAGNLLVVCLVISKQTGVAFFDLLGRLTPDIVADLMAKSFDVMDLVFYAIAIYEAFKLSTAQPQPVVAAATGAAAQADNGKKD